MRAAGLHEIGQDKLEVLDDVEAVGFGPGRVRIRVRATGLCHSDLSAMSGVLPQPAPFVPGHEGAGEILDVGDGVTGLVPGRRVLLCRLPACGSCAACRRGQTRLCLAGFVNAGTPNFKRPGGDVFGFAGTGTFTEEVVVDAGCAVPIPDDVPFDIAALIGCGVTTGLGAAINTAEVEAGSSVAVIGCGIVGLTTSTALALARYGVTANAICPRARTRMTEDAFAGFAEPTGEDELDPLSPEHVAPLVGYLASPAAARVNGQLLVVHGGMAAVVERPRVAATFDTAKEAFGFEELDGLLTPYFAERPPNETFAAAEVLGLKKG
ncbi:hypothetical protein GCM10010282_04620 [Streptomyces roseolus]|nr:hypothetical protein GCM10010282_04620 [Streptomyces roseolus]